MLRTWHITILETDSGMSALITREGTDKNLTVNVRQRDYLDRNEMIAELFAGPLPNIRDSFDTV